MNNFFEVLFTFFSDSDFTIKTLDAVLSSVTDEIVHTVCHSVTVSEAAG